MIKKHKVVDIPDDGIIYGNGYVYINVSSEYDPSVKYTRSTRRCIGKHIDGRSMYANDIYRSLFDKDYLPDPPKRSDAISVGMHLLIRQISETCGLDKALAAVFDEYDSRSIKDLAAFMVTSESAVFQHYPAFGFSNALFSEGIFSDSQISRFLHGGIKPTLVQQFLDEWAESNRSTGKAYLCYDSTNINCVADGVELAQMGHAKDDATKP